MSGGALRGICLLVTVDKGVEAMEGGACRRLCALVVVDEGRSPVCPQAVINNRVIRRIVM